MYTLPLSVSLQVFAYLSLAVSFEAFNLSSCCFALTCKYIFVNYLFTFFPVVLLCIFTIITYIF